MTDSSASPGSARSARSARSKDSNGSDDPTAELFLEALDRPLAERDAFLRRRCRDDVQRHAVERLLASDADVPEGFLPRQDARHASGTRVGSFELVQQLGEGGMGTVWLARQDLPHREVALKLIRPERVSPSMVQRFTQEAQVLGSLQHPGISQIFEAGTARVRGADGVEHEEPYLAMEFLRGDPLLEHATKARLGLRERLEIIARIADALHHAHQRGVIHRDLKPENVLVVPVETSTTEADFATLGQPKVLDFGIARLVHADAPDVTREGELVGTLSAMSPEQVEGSGALDARSDVWALGVLAYRLLSGEAPHDLTGRTIPEALRVLRTERPLPLSHHDARLRGDASTIVARALEADPARRYASAAALAEDIRRHLRGEAIRARSDSRLYVLRRGLSRHVRSLALVTTVAALLTLFWLQLQEKQALARASEEQLARALESIAQFERFGLEHLQEAPEKRALFRSVLEEQRKLLDGKETSPAARLARAKTRCTVGILSYVLDEPQGLDELDAGIAELEALQDALPQASIALAEALGERALFDELQGRTAEAKALLERSLALDVPVACRARAETKLARLARASGDHEGAMQLYRKALASLDVAPDTGEELTTALAVRVQALSGMGTLLAEQGRIAEAVETYAPIDALLPALEELPAQRDSVVSILINRGILQDRTGDREGGIESLQKAVELSEELVGRSDAHVLFRRDQGIALFNLGSLLARAERFEDAQAQFQRGANVVGALLEGANVHPENEALHAMLLLSLAKLDLDAERDAEALPLLERVLPAFADAMERTPGRREYPLAYAEAVLGRALSLVRLGRHADAVASMEGVVHDRVPKGKWKRLRVLSLAVETARVDPQLAEEDRDALAQSYVENAVELVLGWIEADPAGEWSYLRDATVFGALQDEPLYQDMLTFADG